MNIISTFIKKTKPKNQPTNENTVKNQAFRKSQEHVSMLRLKYQKNNSLILTIERSLFYAATCYFIYRTMG